MMRRLLARLTHNTGGSAAVEMALVAPLLLILMFGSMEMGNFFLNEHALLKQVRDGARFASRLQFEDVAYACPAAVWKSEDVTPAPEVQIANVVQTGTVDGTGEGRFPASYWAPSSQCGTSPTIDIAIRCVVQEDAGLSGVYRDLPGDIPVVKVSAAIEYRPVLAAIGVNLAGKCLRAESEVPVTGL